MEILRNKEHVRHVKINLQVAEKSPSIEIITLNVNG